MQAGVVVNQIPVPSIRGLGTASRVNDASKAVVWHAFGLANCAATRQPAVTRRRGILAALPTESELDDRRGIAEHFDKLARLIKREPGRQGRLVNTDVVSLRHPW